jgi:hypothetical protein
MLARGRAVEVGGVEAIQSQSGGGQRVEVRRLQLRVTVVSGIAPALIIGHDQHDVWLWGFGD